MDVKNDISEELRLLSAVVAAIGRQTPYEVPEGYFLDLSARVLQLAIGQRVRGEVESKSLTFSVPEGYFEGFAQQVLNRIKSGAAGVGATLNVSADADRINERSEGNRGEARNEASTKVAGEARETSEARTKVAGEAQRGGGGTSMSDGPERDEPSRSRFGEVLSSPDEALGDDPYSSILTEAGRRTPYSVPNGYFEANVPLLCVARVTNPYTVPADYFEGQAPLLAVARSGNPYTVPAGYFDEQATADRVAAAMHATVGGAGSKVIGLGVRKMSWMKYAAAAVVAGLILSVGLLRIHVKSDKISAPIDIARTMSTVSDQELQNFLTVQGATFEQPVNSASLDAASLGADDGDLKSLLGNVPDGELKQYMEEHGGANDIATN
jgi:hypothetical protein